MGLVTTHIIESGPRAGWISWSEPDFQGFLQVVGPSFARRTRKNAADVAIATRVEHGNRLGALHGGFLAGFADHAYFAALTAMERDDLVAGITVDLTMQFFGTGTIGPDLEASVEVLRETGRLLFMRLIISQEGNEIAASTATIRKPSHS